MMFSTNKVVKTFRGNFISIVRFFYVRIILLIFLLKSVFFLLFSSSKLKCVEKSRALTDVSNGSKNAVGEMIPVRLLTTIAMPVSINGSLKSTTASRSAFIISDVRTMSALRFTKSEIKPFHFPFSSVPHLPSSVRTSSYVKPVCKWKKNAKTHLSRRVFARCCFRRYRRSVCAKSNTHTQMELNCKVNPIYPMVRQTFPINQYKIQSNTDRSYRFDEPVQCQYCFVQKRKEQ